ncbi:MAG: diaminopimelate dehydrogenase [Ruminococcaceae bacterium]|nr:diaminopimelate dehydrogenase [Oscillospiraceae bacterium]
MKIGIYGYGNLGRGVECAVRNRPDTELVAVFTRRNPDKVKTLYEDTRVYSVDDVKSFRNKIDVMIICGGSATDLPVMTPMLAEYFNVLDSFDTHAKIPEHFEKIDKVAQVNDHIALIAAGWDPGLFSLMRMITGACLPNGADYTFWGRGISQGHSDAIRRIEGVLDARQYTVPVESAVNAVVSGEFPTFTAAEMHRRECFVVAKEDADKEKIAETIKNMPNYFADYETSVNFITQEELDEQHSGMPHGGAVIRTGRTGVNSEHMHAVEFSLDLESNPEFTASVLVAYAVAIYKMYMRGDIGCKTVFDVAPRDLSYLSPEELRAKLL